MVTSALAIKENITIKSQNGKKTTTKNKLPMAFFTELEQKISQFV